MDNIIRIADGYQRLRGPLEDRFYEVKHLLAIEKSVGEISMLMDVHPASVYRFLERRGWGDFLQPGIRKKQWRDRCAGLTMKLGDKESEVMAMLDMYINIAHRNIVKTGLQVDREEVASEVHECLAKAIRDYKPDGEASFKTYFVRCLDADIKNLKNHLAHRIIGKMTVCEADLRSDETSVEETAA